MAFFYSRSRNVVKAGLTNAFEGRHQLFFTPAVLKGQVAVIFLFRLSMAFKGHPGQIIEKKKYSNILAWVNVLELDKNWR